MSTHPVLVTARGDGIRGRAVFRSSRFVLTSRGVRLPSGSQDPLATIRAALAPLPAIAATWGPSGALVLGLPLPQLDNPRAHVIVPRSVARPVRRDIVVHQGTLVTGEVAERHGIRTANGPRVFADLAALLTLPDLVAVGDAVLASGYSIEDVTWVVERRGRYPGRAKARYALDWLDAGAESPQESRLRVNLRLAGLPSPRVNATICDRAGRFVARGDLVFDEAKLVVEYDGAYHLNRSRQRSDAARRAALQALGWMVLELNALDLIDPACAVAKVRAALRSRGVAC